MKSPYVKSVNLKLNKETAKNLHRYLKETIDSYPENIVDDYVVDARKLIVSLERVIEEYNI